MPLYELLVAFGLGVAATLVVTFGLAWLTIRRDQNPPPSGATPAEADPEEEALFTCEYHDRAFYDAEEAFDHAVQQHNAPKEGEAWKHTYPEGRE